MGEARHLADSGDDELESVEGNEDEAVREPQTEADDAKPRHADVPREEPADADGDDPS